MYFTANAQIDTLRSKATIEAYVKSELKYKSLSLLDLNTLDASADSLNGKAAEAKYWINGDFDNDGRIDLLAFATIQDWVGNKDNNLFVILNKEKLSKKGKSSKIVSIANSNYYKSFHNLIVVPGMISTNNKTYLTLVAKKPAALAKTQSTELSCDTVFIVNDRPMVYKAHPSTNTVKQIRFSTHGCYGDCPVFEIHINSDRSVAFDGITKVKKTGNFTSEINELDYNYLIDLIKKLNVPLLQAVKPNHTLDIRESDLQIIYKNGNSEMFSETFHEEGLGSSYVSALLLDFLIGLHKSKYWTPQL